MEVDWTTFALEIINFLILVWILKRFFYHPVLDIIARRRICIETADCVLCTSSAARVNDPASEMATKVCNWSR